MSLPWVRLKELRKALGLTQAELADGILTQSMLCHIERGRVIPKEPTLRAFLERLQVDVDAELEPWKRWRLRGRIRDRLWIALILEDAESMASLLEEGETLLVPFEAGAFSAVCAALAGDWSQAQLLLAADSMTRPPARARRTVDAPPVELPSQRVAGGPNRDVYAGAWTHIDKARALVAEAKARCLLSEHFGEANAALYWKQMMAERLWETIWRGA